ncbi:hypothetical protein BCR37DRAFT_381446 [Protomyces lactucae-debilis]|uniref:Uncharacterized protein n=1 Tax=Protomyces lactucae-debilis TaxID=2754530 RepID=A0A1Y2F820_PROLT|nr:uncharacterized protein BCR37DRAFT_381446 [Protomyces lactucae-debilis]ORY79999.1 hypothetical protein BCR37DRAFT_381446 [Protomyces lactucae-debilis]
MTQAFVLGGLYLIAAGIYTAKCSGSSRFSTVSKAKALGLTYPVYLVGFLDTCKDNRFLPLILDGQTQSLTHPKRIIDCLDAILLEWREHVACVELRHVACATVQYCLTDLMDTRGEVAHRTGSK